MAPARRVADVNTSLGLRQRVVAVGQAVVAVPLGVAPTECWPVGCGNAARIKFAESEAPGERAAEAPPSTPPSAGLHPSPALTAVN